MWKKANIARLCWPCYFWWTILSNISAAVSIWLDHQSFSQYSLIWHHCDFVGSIILNNFFDFFHFWHDCWPSPIDYPIRFWSTFVVTLTLNFQSQIWNLLYLRQNGPIATKRKAKISIELYASNVTIGFDLDHDIDLEFSRSNMEFAIFQTKWCDCHETKSKDIDWTLCLKCDHQVWPWAWHWPWIFKVKCGICYISAKKWPHCHETRSKNIDWTQCLKCDHRVWP